MMHIAEQVRRSSFGGVLRHYVVASTRRNCDLEESSDTHRLLQESYATGYTALGDASWIPCVQFRQRLYGDNHMVSEISCAQGILRSASNARDVAEYLRDLSAPPEAVRAAIWRLGSRDLYPYGYEAYHLNVLSLFGGEWSSARIKRTAMECARRRLWEGWSCHAYIVSLKTRLAAAPSQEVPALMSSAVHCRGWQESGFDQIARNGAIVCGFHIAAFRHIFIDLILRGYTVAQPFDDNAYTGFSRSFDGMYPPLRSRVQIVNVERERSKVVLAEALAEGRLVVAYVDGNTGSDGRRGTYGRSIVHFKGYPIHVKNGLARLAAAAGVPLVPVFTAQAPDGKYDVRVDQPIEPPSGSNPDTYAEFVQNAMETLYSALERRVVAYPEQWEATGLLHQWRTPTPPSVASELASKAAVGALLATLDAGKSLRFNDGRFMRFDSRSKGVWLDTRTLSVYKPSPLGREIITALRTRQGITAEWLAGCAARLQPASHALACLAQMDARGMIAARD